MASSAHAEPCYPDRCRASLLGFRVEQRSVQRDCNRSPHISTDNQKNYQKSSLRAQTYSAISPRFAIKIESSDFSAFGVVVDTVEAALLNLRTTGGPRRDEVRRREESGIVREAADQLSATKDDPTPQGKGTFIKQLAYPKVRVTWIWNDTKLPQPSFLYGAATHPFSRRKAQLRGSSEHVTGEIHPPVFSRFQPARPLHHVLRRA